jgi:hypothetical protein
MYNESGQPKGVEIHEGNAWKTAFLPVARDSRHSGDLCRNLRCDYSEGLITAVFIAVINQ